MNRQEVFNKVATHLLTQKTKSLTPEAEESVCAYKSGDLKCAIGCLIPDKLYNKNFEGYGVSQLPEKVIAALGCENQEDEWFLTGMQQIHDRRDPDEWENELLVFAERYQLDCKVISDICGS